MKTTQRYIEETKALLQEAQEDLKNTTQLITETNTLTLWSSAITYAEQEEAKVQIRPLTREQLQLTTEIQCLEKQLQILEEILQEDGPQPLAVGDPVDYLMTDNQWYYIGRVHGISESFAEIRTPSGHIEVYPLPDENLRRS
jgi:hypothetical protein